MIRSSNENLLGRKSIAEVKDKIWLDTINAGKQREFIDRQAEHTPRKSYSRESIRKKDKSKTKNRPMDLQKRQANTSYAKFRISYAQK